MPPAAAADINPQLGGFQTKGSLESADERGRDARRMPIHSQHTPESLEPKGIAQSRQQFVGTVLDHDSFGDGPAESRHSLGEPLRDIAAMQRQIGMT